MARTTIRSEDIADGEILVADVADDSITNAKIKSDAAIAATKLSGTLDLSSKTVTLPAASVTAHVTAFDDNQLKEDIALLGFKAATNGSLAKYDLVDQTEDIFQDASGIDASASTNEARDLTKFYSGTSAAPTGGTITTYTDSGTDYVVHSFLSSGNFVTTINGNVDYLIVAGGGAGGGGNIGGGGGGGGLLTAAALATTAQTYAVVVGAGGIWNNTASSNAATKKGGDSSAFGITATGGGQGGSGSGGDGGAGGSGGGWHGYNLNGTGNTGIAGPPRQGYDGGAGAGSPGYAAGGGGGAGEVGQGGIAGTASIGGDGGDGLQNDYRTGSDVYYSGGGAGMGNVSAGGVGGLGGGGSAGPSRDSVAGTANTGGGGGGSTDASVATNGGSGIVVIRYVDGTLNPIYDMTLISNATTAETQATKADFVMTMSMGTGTLALGDGTNGDVRAFASRDNGTTYTQFTLTDQGDTGGHTILTSHDLSISGQPAGTAMRYKITTHNQSASKETRVQAVSLGWS